MGQERQLSDQTLLKVFDGGDDLALLTQAERQRLMTLTADHGSAPAEAKPKTMSDVFTSALRSKGIEPTQSQIDMNARTAEGVMGGGVGAGGLKIVGDKAVGLGSKIAQRLYSGLLKPSKGIKDGFGGANAVADTLLNERAPITRGGLAKVTGRVSGSRSTAMQMVKDAEAAGTQGVVAKDVLGEFKPVVEELRKRADIGQGSELAKVGARGKAILKTTARTGGDIPLTKAQALKETAQDASSGAYRAMERGAQKQLSGEDLLDTAVARGLKGGIERKVPGVGPQNARTQSLLGGMRALEDAVEREGGNNMVGGGRDWAAMMAGIGGTATGGPVTGALAAGGMRALATPSTGSMAAIALNEASKSGVLDGATRAAILSMLQQRSNGQ